MSCLCVCGSLVDLWGGALKPQQNRSLAQALALAWWHMAVWLFWTRGGSPLAGLQPGTCCRTSESARRTAPVTAARGGAAPSSSQPQRRRRASRTHEAAVVWRNFCCGSLRGAGRPAELRGRVLCKGTIWLEETPMQIKSANVIGCDHTNCCFFFGILFYLWSETLLREWTLLER